VNATLSGGSCSGRDKSGMTTIYKNSTLDIIFFSNNAKTMELQTGEFPGGTGPGSLL